MYMYIYIINNIYIYICMIIIMIYIYKYIFGCWVVLQGAAGGVWVACAAIHALSHVGQDACDACHVPRPWVLLAGCCWVQLLGGAGCCGWCWVLLAGGKTAGWVLGAAGAAGTTAI